MTTNKKLLLTDEERERYWFVKTDYENNFGKALEAQLKKATDYYEPLIEKARKEIWSYIYSDGTIPSDIENRYVTFKIPNEEYEALKQELKKGDRDANTD